MHALLSHFNRFPSNCGDDSDKHSLRAHQDFLKVDVKFNGKSMVSELGGNCYSLNRETYPA